MTEKKIPLEEDRADVKAWREVCVALERVQGKVFAFQHKVPCDFVGEKSASQIVFDAAMLVGDAWRKLKELEDRPPMGWEKLEAYEPAERSLDVHFDCLTARRKAA